MSNNFYNHGTFPSRDTPGTSANMRNEFDLIGAGFEKMPPLIGNEGKFVRVNVLGTALEVTDDLNNTTINGVIIGGTAPAAATFTDVTATTITVGTITSTVWNVPTLPVGSSGSGAASVDYVNAMAYSLNLPGQSGNAGKELVTDNTNVTWGYNGKRVPRTSNTILTKADNRKFIDITSGTFTQTFDAAATVGDGWTCFVRNAGTGRITIPSSDGMTNWIMYPGESRLFQCDGANFFSCWITPFAVEMPVTETLIRPPGYLFIDGEFWSAAGGGGSGQCGGAAQAKNGGGGGGGGGYCRRLFSAAEIGASILVTIGAGGAGGVGTLGAGNSGVVGGNTTFGSLLTIAGGTGGALGQSGVTTPTVGGGGPLGSGSADLVGSSGQGNSSEGTAGITSSGRVFAGCGGAGGGAETIGNALQPPGAGGSRNVSSGGGGAAGTSSAASPTAGGAGAAFQGGGGGGSSQSAPAGAGGAGGRASGGGGGGSSRTGFLSGAGGDGGDGYAIIRGV